MSTWQLDPAVATGFTAMWSELAALGRGPGAGYRRFAWTAQDAACRDWFRGQAADRGLDLETDRNGNLWAWWGRPGPDAFVTGSHLDSVPDGGGYDGPLGVVSAFAAVDAARAAGIEPRRPVAVVCFVDEEGARFGVACVGSRLAAGTLDPDVACGLRDSGGVSLAEAVRAAGLDPARLGPDPGTLGRIGVFVELHVEQGRALADLDAPVGVASAIGPHGRWRFDFAGEANHAGTTRLVDRRDPMLPLAATVLAARDEAAAAGAVATVGRLFVEPNGTNAVPGAVRAWLDARAGDPQVLDRLVAAIGDRARRAAQAERVDLTVTAESVSPAVEFAADARARIRRVLEPLFGRVPVLPTGAGHDAGVLGAVLPTAMLFVRNPTGMSHAPGEFAAEADCLAGVAALAAVMADWVIG